MKETATLGFPSTELEDLEFLDRARGVQLRLSHEADDGSMAVAGWEFAWTRAYRHRAESHCTVWHIEHAYDTLVEVEDSEWVAELRDAMPEDMRTLFEMHHYMIYVDSYGCYEVVAQTWAPLPGGEASHGEGRPGAE